MATNALTFTLTPGMAPAAPLMRMLGQFDRAKIEAFAEISVALLDLMDGDPDMEDATDAEDEGLTPAALAYTDGPGCIIADPDYAVDDQPCDNDDDREPEDGY